jgi:hypothetical protein
MGDNFLPKTEQEIKEPIIKKLLQRASEACYWKEEFENQNSPENAWLFKCLEQTWLDAVAIVKEERW